MRAGRQDLAAVEDDDLARAAHRREAVGDHERRAPLEEAIERALDEVLGLGVERARRLVDREIPDARKVKAALESFARPSGRGART